MLSIDFGSYDLFKFICLFIWNKLCQSNKIHNYAFQIIMQILKWAISLHNISILE